MNKLIPGLKRNWLLLLVFFFFSIAIAVFVSSYMKWSSEKILDEVSNQLTTLGKMKSMQISVWKQERLVDGQTIQTDHSFSQNIYTLLKNFNDLSVIRENQDRLRALLFDPNYSSAFLFNQSGERIMRVGEMNDQPGDMIPAAIQQTSISHEITISDLYRASDGSVKMDMLVPIFLSEQENKPAIAFVDFIISPDAYLYPLIQELPDEEQTTETLIVQKQDENVLFLNDLRFTKNAALNLRIPLTKNDVPAVMAINGKTGIVYGNDYRGEAVMAYIKSVDGTDWKIVAKMDKKEIYQPINRQDFSIIITTIVLFLSSTFLISFIWRKRTAQITQGLTDSEFRRKTLEKKYLALFNQANDAILLVQEDGKIIEVNDQAVHLYGYSRDEFLKLSVTDLRNEPLNGQISTDMERVKSGQTNYFETTHCKKNGEFFPVEVSSRYLVLEGKGVFQSLIRDVSERKKVEEDLLKSAEALNKAQRVANVGSWHFDRVNNKMTWSDEMYAILGIPKSDEGLNFDPLIKEFTLPDEYQRIKQITESAIQAKQVYSFDVRIKRRDGLEREIWVEAGELFFDDQHNIIAISGIVQDITDKMKIEKELRKNENLLQRIYDLLPVGMWITDEKGNMIRSNKMIKEIWGKDILVGMDGNDVFHGRRLPSRQEIAPDDWASVHTIKEGVTTIGEMVEIDAYDGKTKTILNYSTPIFDEAGKLEGSIILNLDISELKKAEEQLSAQLDELRRWNLATLGRENRIRELKTEINTLLEKLGEPPKYQSVKDEEN